jgi:hypothetical protein
MRPRDSKRVRERERERSGDNPTVSVLLKKYITLGHATWPALSKLLMSDVLCHDKAHNIMANRTRNRDRSLCS